MALRSMAATIASRKRGSANFGLLRLKP